MPIMPARRRLVGVKGYSFNKGYYMVVVGIGEIIDELIQWLLKRRGRASGENRQLAQAAYPTLLFELLSEESLRHGNGLGRVHVGHVHLF